MLQFGLCASLHAVTLAELMHADPPPKSQPYMEGATPEQQLYCFSPRDVKPGDKRPAVVCIHGGAWVAGGADVFFPHARYFASRGAVAFSINYRLVKAEGSSVADCVADCRSAIRYIRMHAAELGVDPDRIVVLGDSAGGHLAAALGTLEGFNNPADNLKVSGTPNAMILCNPIVNMTDGSWMKFIIRGQAFDKHAPPEAMVPTAEQMALGRQLSPLFQIHKGQPPALLMHGLDDHVVNPEQARHFAAASKSVNARCDLVLLEGARHAFIVAGYTAPETMVVDAIRKIDQFLVSLNYLTGNATLEVSNPPAWPDKKK